MDRKTDQNADQSAKVRISHLRLLDFDDLFLLSHLLKGNTIASTARYLGLTQPAITQRVRKIERVFVTTILKRVGRNVQLTPKGEAIAMKAKQALLLMGDIAPFFERERLTIASQNTFGKNLVWPATHASESPFDLQIVTSSEIFSMLKSGATSMAVTDLQAPTNAFTTLEIGELEYVFVASQKVGEGIQEPSDLAKVDLIEAEISEPYLGKFPEAVRKKLNFNSTRYLGDYDIVIAVVENESGVAFTPLPFVKTRLESGSLIQILPGIELPTTRLNLIIRNDLMKSPGIDGLINHLRRILGGG